ncbi:hypothetical protein [Rhizobium phage RHph_N46]|nr:hypothetical protein [Rhizobium phage RHph_N46]
MKRFTNDEIAVFICAMFAGAFFAWWHTRDLLSFCFVAVVGFAAGVALFGIVRTLVAWTAELSDDGFDFNLLSWLGIGGKSYDKAYAALFKAVRAYEDDADIRFFNRREVFIKAGYSARDDISFKDQRAASHAWNAIRPLLELYSKEDASRTLFVGFIKP